MATRRCVEQAFILSAGMGKRLRPLTERLPKPLVPLYHRPLAAWSMDACVRAGIRRFAINTHHLPDAWRGFAAQSGLVDTNVSLFHEPVLLNTGGALRNIESWISARPLLIHNGDIFTTMPLEKLIAAHLANDCAATLALRTEGPQRHVGVDATRTRVTDVRNALGTDPGSHVFSGVYCINPEFLDSLPADGVFSVIPAFVELARQGRLGAIVIDEGEWLDLGDRSAYLLANRKLHLAPDVHQTATVERGAEIGQSIIGRNCVVASTACIRDSVLWPGTRIMAGASLKRCIVYSGRPISGSHSDADL